MNLRSAIVVGGVFIALCAAATPTLAQKSVAEVLGRPATPESQPKTYLEELTQTPTMRRTGERGHLLERQQTAIPWLAADQHDALQVREAR